MTVSLLKFHTSYEALGEMVDNIEDFVFIQDPQGKYIYVNKSASFFINNELNRNPILGKKPIDILTKEEAERINNQIDTVVKRKEFIYSENWIRSNNKKYCFRIFIFPLVIKNDVVELVGQIARDITLEKQLRKTSKQGKVNFERVVQNMPFGILISQNNSIKLVNKEFENITEYFQSDIKRLDDFINIFTDTYQNEISNICSKLNKGNPNTIEIEVELKNEKIDGKHVKLNFLKMLHEGKPALMIMIFDMDKIKIMGEVIDSQRQKIDEITEEKIKLLKESNSKIEIRNQYLSDIIDSSNDLIIAFDHLKNLRIWNRGLEVLSGIKFNDIEGKNLSKFDFIEPKEKIVECILKKECDKKFDLTIRTIEGSHKIIRCTPSIIINKYGEMGGLLLVGVNITNVKKLHTNLVPGSSYLVTPEQKNLSKNLITNLLEQDYSLFFVTRGHNEFFTEINNNTIYSFQWRYQPGEKNTIYSLNDLLKKIVNFMEAHKKSVIYIERIDYITVTEKFNDIINSIYKINDSILDKNSYVFLEINQMLFNQKDFEYLKTELNPLPIGSFTTCNLLPKELEILRFINSKNQKNILVAYKDIRKQFSMVNQTTANWLKTLEKKGVVNIVKNGKRKNLFATEKGKMALLEK